MISQEQIESLTSTAEEFDTLYNSDNLYIVKAVTQNDEKLEGFIEGVGLEYCQFRKPIRAKIATKESRSQVKIENNDNKDDILHGYVYGVNSAQVNEFEMNALMPSMKYSYRFQKYNMNDIKTKEQEQILEKLKEENNG